MLFCVDVDVWSQERVISKFNQVAMFTWQILYFISYYKYLQKYKTAIKREVVNIYTEA